MRAAYDTNISIRGTSEELAAAISLIIDSYSDISRPRKFRPNVYFDCIYVFYSKNGLEPQHSGDWKSLSLFYSSNLERNTFFKELSECDTLYIRADGPYGYFSNLSGVAFFHDLAHTIPNATFSGSISGGDSGGDDYEQEACLEDGLLCLTNSYYSSEERLDDFWEILPWDDFAELFHIDEEDEDDVDYNELIYVHDFPDTDYETFLSVCPTAKITKDEYEAALEKVRALGSTSYDDSWHSRQTVHDPRTWDPDQKKYIKPVD